MSALNNCQPEELLKLRFQHRPELQFHAQEIDGEPGYVVTDPLRNCFFHLGEREQRLLAAFAQPTTLAEALQTVNHELLGAETDDPLTVAEVVSLLAWFEQRQLLTRLQPTRVLPAGSLAETSATVPSTGKSPGFNPLGFTLWQFNPDQWVGRLLPHLGWLFQPLALWPAGILAIWAVAKLACEWSAFRAQTSHVLDPAQWLRIGGVWLVVKVIHELGHALAAKRFGVPVRRAGVGIFLFAPAPFVDVTPAWGLPSRWQRMAISAAGMYVELLVAAFALVLWTPNGSRTVDRICLDTVLATGLTTLLFNANPLVRFDGYYLLCDAFGISNLYEKGQRAFRGTLARVVCRANDPASSPAASSPGAAIGWTLYGGAAWAWRMSMLVGFIGGAWLSTGWLGAIAVVVLLFVYQFPWRTVRHFFTTQKISWQAWRQVPASTYGVAAVLLVATTWWLSSPTFVSAPAIVEYAPLVEVRATESGFVERIHVAAGDWVNAGQVVATLHNDDLQREFAAARAALEEANVRARLHLSNDDLPKHQKQQAEIASLEQRVHELKTRCAALEVSATQAGQVLTRDLEQWLGRYVAVGDSLVQLGDEHTKEIIVSIAHGDEEAFSQRLGEAVRVYVAGSKPLVLQSQLASIEPRAAVELAHPSLGAHNGGPIAVRDGSGNTTTKTSQHFESCDARFLAKVSLDAVASLQLRAGQRVSIGTSAATISWGQHLLRSGQAWLQQRIQSR